MEISGILNGQQGTKGKPVYVKNQNKSYERNKIDDQKV
jgi:hypothetical protein